MGIAVQVPATGITELRSKLERNLGWHLGAWILWRNYAREITCRALRVSSASAAGVTTRRLRPRELFEWVDRLPASS